MSERAKKHGLRNKTIAVPENRQLLLLLKILETRGASVRPVPMVAILDAPDPAPVLEWLKRFIDTPPELLVLLTGEGLRRLLALADKHGLQDAFISRLAGVEKMSRGPKPERALREIGLAAEYRAETPTTDGVIATLDNMALHGKRVAVQLYGEDPNRKLVDYLEKNGAQLSTVAPYVYAGKAEDEKVLELIRAMDKGEIDVIAFTSQPQFDRLQQVAAGNQLEEVLLRGLKKTRVAAVGPVVRDRLEEAGVRVDIMPERTFFMKPMVTAIAEYFTK